MPIRDDGNSVGARSCVADSGSLYGIHPMPEGPTTTVTGLMFGPPIVVVKVLITVAYWVHDVGTKVSITVTPLIVDVSTVAPVGREDREVAGAGLGAVKVGRTGAAVGHLSAVGCTVQLAQPIVGVPDRVSGSSGTFVPPQLQ